jgi:hypothetical protein
MFVVLGTAALLEGLLPVMVVDSPRNGLPPPKTHSLPPWAALAATFTPVGRAATVAHVFVAIVYAYTVVRFGIALSRPPAT